MDQYRLRQLRYKQELDNQRAIHEQQKQSMRREEASKDFSMLDYQQKREEDRVNRDEQTRHRVRQAIHDNVHLSM